MQSSQLGGDGLLIGVRQAIRRMDGILIVSLAYPKLQ
jgi:hypothetical protein